MANTSKINGFTPVKHTNGSPYNGQANLYYIASAADEMFVGDVVKVAGSADANGIPSADLCGASDVPVGIVVGVMHSKFEPAGKMTTGSTALDSSAVLPKIAVSGAAYVMVADSPDIVCEVEAANGTPAATDIGLNISHSNGTRSATTSVNPAYIDFGTEATANTLNFRLLGFSQKVGNEIGASAKMLVGFNVHQFTAGTGSTGI